MTTIYLDVLILLNLFVTFFLFQATAKLMSLRPKKWRLLAGTLLGGLFSLLILFDLTALEQAAIRLMMGAALVFTVFFRRKSTAAFFKSALCFFFVNFLFGGFMQALWIFAAPAGMTYRNGVAYFNISALTLTLSTIAAYLAVSVFAYILNKRNRKSELLELTISLRGRQVALTGFVDSGNKLCDIFTGLPVIVCEFGAVQALFPERIRRFFQDPAGFSFEEIEDSSLKTLLRVIPVNAVSGASSLPAFRPDGLEVAGEARQAVVAVTTQSLSDGSFRALLSPALEGEPR